MAISIKSEREIQLMRESCKMLAGVFEQLEHAIKPGMSTWELDALGGEIHTDIILDLFNFFDIDAGFEGDFVPGDPGAGDVS